MHIKSHTSARQDILTREMLARWQSYEVIFLESHFTRLTDHTRCKQIWRETDRQTDRQPASQADRQTDRQRHRQTYRKTDIQRKTETAIETESNKLFKHNKT